MMPILMAFSSAIQYYDFLLQINYLKKAVMSG